MLLATTVCADEANEADAVLTHARSAEVVFACIQYSTLRIFRFHSRVILIDARDRTHVMHTWRM